MDKLIRFIDIYIPVTACNLKCHYCYIAKSNRRGVEAPELEYSAEHIGRALSKERLGGTVLFNMCGWGETMLMPALTDITREILAQGHYVWIVTNGLITKRFDEMMNYPKEYLERLAFKFSFHYLELKRINKMELFFETIEKVKQAGCSFTIELTSCDELEPYIKEMKELVRSKARADLHVTIPRDGGQKHYPLMSRHTLEEYKNIWSGFNSDMFDFKMSVWGQKRTEFCYAGSWTGLLNISNGEFKACYSSALRQNIFKNIKKPINFVPIGKHCKMAHCHNSHSFLALGNIPEIKSCNYGRIRNRSCDDGTEWLNPRMKEFMSQRLCDNNKQESPLQKFRSEIYYQSITKSRKLVRKLKGLE
ncbi:MAG: radical protein [Herbinix sp.]|jgi:pyruvate-formate lyase-activating enzyme|nr:radical protein [Herbinix sp.]MDF2842117.1 radical protein [Herbinix sp.]